jgi:hypothetical protein
MFNLIYPDSSICALAVFRSEYMEAICIIL